MKTFKTPKGTELPIMDIKGKDYLQAAPRIVWLREEHPDWGIETEFLVLTESSAVCKATIRDGNGKILAQASSMETKQGFESFVEKAETCAVSRAASFCNYGTLMAQDLEEHGKLAEAPQDRKQPSEADPGAYVMKMGKEYKDQRLDAIDIYKLAGFWEWLEKKKNDPDPKKRLDALGLETLAAIEAFLKSREFARNK